MNTRRPGAAIEVTFYDAAFDSEDGAQSGESRDDFVMLFVGAQSSGDHASAA